MKSIAIWYKERSSDLPKIESIELHFNFWKLPNETNGHIRFLDIGIKVPDTSNVDILKIYFPTSVKPSDFSDIVDNFIARPDLVSAIFNENYKVLSNGTSKVYQIQDIHNSPVFSIYKTSSSDVNFHSNYSGTIVGITVPQTVDPLYFRFRVKGEFIASLSSMHIPTNAVLDSAFSEIEMIDFRVNEARDLDQSLLEAIAKENPLKISRQHFFFICSNEEEIVGSHQPYINCRNLENYRWKDYVNIQSVKEQIFLAYHWKDSPKVNVSALDDTSILIKTKYEKNNWCTILKYAIVALGISIAIEMFCNWLYDCLK